VRQLTLSDVKNANPKSGHFRYFFHTKEEGSGVEVKDELRGDNDIVPLFNGRVEVECIQMD